MSFSKPIDTLLQLSQYTWVRLVCSSINCIEQEFSTGFDNSQCQEKAQNLQDYLLHNPKFPPTLWQWLFDAVLDLKVLISDLGMAHFPVDDRIFYATFVQSHLRKLVVPSLENMLTERDCYRKSVAFWLEYVPKLTKLVEVDLSRVDCDEVIVAFCQTCTLLEVVVLPEIVDCQHERWIRLALEQLKHLKSLNVQVFASMLIDMNPSPPLKLTKLDLRCRSSREFYAALNLCPDLKELNVDYISSCDDRKLQGSDEGLPQLLAPSLQITKLKWYRYNQETLGNIIDEFFTYKGKYIKELEFISESGSPTLSQCFMLISCISENCKNLTKLSLAINLARGPSLSSVTPLSFTQLEHFSLKTDNWVAGVYFADHCLANAPNLTSFELNLDLYGHNVFWHGGLVVLLRCNQQMKTLKKLRLLIRGGYAQFPLPVALGVHVACPALECLEMGPLDEDAELYLKQNLQLVEFKKLNCETNEHINTGEDDSNVDYNRGYYISEDDSSGSYYDDDTSGFYCDDDFIY